MLYMCNTVIITVLDDEMSFMPNICCFQLFKSEDFLLAPLFFLTGNGVSLTIQRHHLGLWFIFYIYIHVRLTCLGSSLYWSFCFPSSPGSHWWSALSWAAAAGSSAWWPPENEESVWLARTKKWHTASAYFFIILRIWPTSWPVAMSMAV